MDNEETKECADEATSRSLCAPKSLLILEMMNETRDPCAELESCFSLLVTVFT